MTIPPEETVGGGGQGGFATVAAVPMDPRVPKIRIKTRQLAQVSSRLGFDWIGLDRIGLGWTDLGSNKETSKLAVRGLGWRLCPAVVFVPSIRCLVFRFGSVLFVFLCVCRVEGCRNDVQLINVPRALACPSE